MAPILHECSVGSWARLHWWWWWWWYMFFRDSEVLPRSSSAWMTCDEDGEEKCLLQSKTAHLQFRKTRMGPPPHPTLPEQIHLATLEPGLPPCPPPRSPPLSLISGCGAPIRRGAAGSCWVERRGATWESVACGGGSGGACGGRWATMGAARLADGWAARRPRRSWNPTWRRGPGASRPWTPARGRRRRRRWSRTLTPAAWRTWWWRLGSWAAWRECFWECTSVGRTQEEVNGHVSKRYWRQNDATLRGTANYPKIRREYRTKIFVLYERQPNKQFE